MWSFVLRCKVEKCILMTDIGAGFRIYYIVGLAAVTLPAGSSTLCMCLRVCAVIPAKNTKIIPVFIWMPVLISVLFMLSYFLFV